MVPKKIIIGYTTRADRSEKRVIAIVAPMKLSKRAKTSLFVITGRKSFERKIDENLQKRHLNNTARDGFTIAWSYVYNFSKSGSTRIYFLWHDDYQGLIQISSETLDYLINNTNIDKGKIAQKLIWTTAGFLTEEDAKLETEELANTEEKKKEKRKEMKPRYVKKADMIQGNYYVYLDSSGKEVIFLYLGKYVRAGKEYFGMHLSPFQSERYRIFNSPLDASHEIQVPSLINGHISTLASRSNYTYKGKTLGVWQSYNTYFKRSLSACYYPDDPTIRNFNLSREYDQQDLDVIKFSFSLASTAYAHTTPELFISTQKVSNEV